MILFRFVVLIAFAGALSANPETAPAAHSSEDSHASAEATAAHEHAPANIAESAGENSAPTFSAEAKLIPPPATAVEQLSPAVEDAHVSDDKLIEHIQTSHHASA
jgi:hypothetical protein